MKQSKTRSLILLLTSILMTIAQVNAASIDVTLSQSNHTSSGSSSVNLSDEGDLDWAVFANSPLTPSTRMSGGTAFTSMTHIGGASESFYNFYAQNNYSWTNGDSPATGSNNLTSNADMGSDGAGVRSTFSIATAGTYRLKFYATTSDTNLSATASLASGGVSDTIAGTLDSGLQRYEFSVDFVTDGSDTLTLDVSKSGGSIILAYEAFSLAAVEVVPVPNLNIESSVSFTNDSQAETLVIPYSNNGQEPLMVSGVTVGGADAAHFSVSSYNSSLAAGADGSISLSFNPGAGDKVYNATLTVASNDSDSPNTLVNVSVNSGNVVSGCVVDLFIVAGQSNANGLGERANFLSSTQAGPHDVKFYCSWHSDGNNGETQQYFSDWADQTEAGYTRAYWYDNRFGNGGALGGDTDAGALGPSSWFGPEIGFAARALEINLTGGNQIGIIKYGVDGSGLNTATKNPGTSDWDLTANGYRQGDAWRGFKAAIADAVAKLEADGITPNFRGMIWWQGEGGTSTDGLNSFISEVRSHLANNYGLENSDDFPVVITTGSKMSGGATLESGVADMDDDITSVNADSYGQQFQIHVGRNVEGSADHTGNGVNDMYDIGEAYADALATIVEPSDIISDCSGDGGGGGSGGGTAEPAPGGGYYVDVFMATGQSNAFYPQDQGEANYYGLGRGVEDVIVASGLFSNPTVVKESAPGWAIGGWYGEWIPGPNIKYQEQFFNDSGTGTLQVKLAEIIAAGNTPRFRGFFWWQGESDGLGDYASSNTSQADYELRYNGILSTLDADLEALGVDSSQYKIVVNTVAESGTQINNILNYIATQGTHSAKSTIYDAINSPHHGNNDVVDAYRDLHDYDHFEVGRANAQLFLDTFPVVTSGYTITFVNVDGSVTTQTVAEGGTPTAPTPINTDTRVFTAWSPTIVAATADATYTAEYGPANGEFVDVFIATGQSNAWGPADDGLWFDSGTNSATYEFGQGVASVLESSDEFSNPVVVFEGAPGQAIGSWWWDGNEEIEFNAPNVLYKQQFFDANNPGVGTLDAKFAEIIAAGNTPRFRGLFWFQGENDGGYNGTSTPNAATPDATYKIRWNGFVDQIAADVGSSDFHFVMNTVGMVDPAINNTFASITTLDSRGVLFDAQVEPYRDFVGGVPNNDVHGYDHFAVGAANAQLFLDTFYSDQPAPSTYTITFINVDDSVTTQVVNEGVVATPPTGVNTANRTFTAWPTIVGANANATYTALYTQTGGDIVDLFIATGQSNAAWPWDSENNVGTFQFGAGVQAALTASGRFSNPTVVSQGEPGMPIDQWWQNGAPQWAYQKNFFGTYQSQTAALEAKIAEIEAAGDTPVFRGVFWFQGEADGQNGTTEADYTERWNSILSQLSSDVGTGDYYFVMNTVGNSGNLINTILTNITNANPRGALFNTQVSPYRTNFADIHGYDHYAVGEANVALFIQSFVDNNPVGGPYTITFVNVDDSVTTQTVNDGVIPTPPSGVNTDTRTFTSWPTIAQASEDTTYTALYTINDGSSSVSVSVAQSASGGQSSTTIDLSAGGNLDWAAWNGELTEPGETMDGGTGFVSLSAIGAATFDGGSFYGQNNYTWTNGSPTASGSTSFAGNATIANLGDGVSLAVNVANAGTYQLKFYTTTYDVNLQATATLASSGLSDTLDGTYNVNSTEKYEYTIDFTTGGADTLTLDLTKSDGANAIFAYEAFSLAGISVEEEVDGLGKIVFIGDSITEGSATRPAGEGNWSWRYAFWKHLVDSNIAHEFVGTSTFNYDPTNEEAFSVYPDYDGQSFVNKHEAYWGLGAVHLANMTPTFLSTLQGQDETPDTAVIFLGGNDIGHDNTVTAQTVRDRIKTIVDNLQGDAGTAGNSDIRIIIVSILPRFDIDGSGDFTIAKAENTHFDEINSLLDTLATEETTQDSEVSYLDLATTFETATDVYYDGVHPNGAGEQLIADGVFGYVANSYTITFINVDGSQTTQTVFEGQVATPPQGVDTATRTFTGWPTIEPATEDATYTALYSELEAYTITFINVDDSQSVYIVDSGTVLTPPTGVDTDTRTFTAWPTIEPATEDATYVALYSVDVGPYDLLWDGGGSDNSWATAENWEGDVLPANGQTLAIINGDTVDIPANNYSLGTNVTVNVAGGSQIDNTAAAARFHTGMIFNFFSGSGIGGQWLQVENTALNFEDGATFTASTVQHRFTSTYGMTLSSTGFTTLTPGSLKSWDESTDWSDVVFNIDVSNYDANNGLVVELMDFSSHDPIYSDNFTPTVNLTAGDSGLSGTLSFDSANSKVIYTFDSVPATYQITFVNVDNSQVIQTVNADEVATPPAGVNTETRTFTAWPTVVPAMEDATYIALYNEVTPSYEITFINVDDSVSTQTVEADEVATPPTGVDTETRTFTAWPTIEPATEDATYVALYSVDVGPYDLLWDGGGSDNSWATAENWEGDVLPANGQTLAIINGDTVDIPANNYSLGTNVTVNVAGGSQIDNTAAAARFHTGMIFNFFSGSGIGGQWLQVENTALNFEDGATFTASTVQHRFTSTYGMTLSSTGFTTLTPGSLKSWDESTDWSDVIFNIDVSKYDANNGLVVELMDFSSHDPIYSENFTPTVNVTAGDSGLSGTLSFDSANSKVIYTFDSVPTTYQITFVNVDDSATIQTVAAGVVATPPAGVNTNFRTFTAWPTIEAASEDASYTALYEAVPPTLVDVYIVAGQSNANGYALVSDLTPEQSTQDALFFTSWHQTAGDAESTQYFSEVEAQTVAGSSRGDAGSSTLGGSATFGPELGFVARANELELGDNPIAIIKYAVDGTSLTANEAVSDWDLTATAYNDGDCWRGFLLALSNAVTALEADNYTPNFKGLVWWQGESGTSATDLNNFIAEVRSHLGANYDVSNVSEFPVVITGTDNRWGTDLEAGVAAIDSYVGYVNANDYGQDYNQDESQFNTHLGSAERGFSTDIDNNGSNDMWDIGQAYADTMAATISGVGNADIVWNGNGSDDLWTTTENWVGNVLPSDNQTIAIANGDHVDIPGNYWDLPSGAVVTVSGNSQIVNTNAAARLYGAMTFNFASGSGMSGAWIDIENATLNFADGATFSPNNIQHKGSTTYGMTFSSTGFSTLTPGALYGWGAEDWSDVTFNIDVSAYDTNNGLSIVLMDFSSHTADFDGTFNPTVNVIAGDSGIGAALSFDASTSQVIATIDASGNDAPIANAATYAYDGSSTVSMTLVASDIEGDPLNYTIVSGPSSGTLSGTAPNLTYTFTGESPQHDSFTYKVNDGAVDSNTATVSIVYTPQSSQEMWTWLQERIENDPLNAATVTTWTEAHSNGSGDTITISRVTYELGTFEGTQHTATPVIAAYYARPTGGSNLPSLLQNHGGGQRAQTEIAKFWAEQGYAAMCINWGGLHLNSANPTEPSPAEGEIHPNTNWDGLAGGFTRVSSESEPLENSVTDAIFWASVDPATFSDGQTLYDIPHPLNSSWSLNGYAVRRAITFLHAQAEVDDTKTGVLGWSMGGRTTMMSSTDPRITVLAPAVGGTGYLYEDFWGLPGTARNSAGWEDLELFKNTVADQSYWPHVSVPVLFLNGSNDFNAPFDLATKSLSIHEIGLDDVSPNNRLVTDPHYNHRVIDSSLAARVHWMRHHLKGDIEYPETSDSELELVTDDGVPAFKVYPDTSTLLPIVSVDIYYGFDRDSRTRFWRDAGAVNMGSHWEAKLPIFDVSDMLVAHAVITYDVGFDQDVPFGSPTNHLTIASKVHTYYPSGVDDDYSLPEELDTAIHQIHVHDPASLVESGVKETAEISYAIDDPSDSDGFKDWFLINASNDSAWQFYTRKVNDAGYRGGEGATFSFELTAEQSNVLVVQMVADDWNGGSTNTYMAYVDIIAGLNEVNLGLSDFKLADGITELSDWSSVKYVGFGSQQALNLGGSAWAGAVPTLAKLAWNGGEHTLDYEVTATWLTSNGLPLSNDALLEDSDGDGQTNWEEFIAGTSPVDASSTFHVSSTSNAEGDFILEWPAVSGKSYAIDFSEDLSADGWVEIATGIVADSELEAVAVEIGSGEVRGFYRVRVE